MSGGLGIFDAKEGKSDRSVAAMKEILKILDSFEGDLGKPPVLSKLEAVRKSIVVELEKINKKWFDSEEKLRELILNCKKKSSPKTISLPKPLDPAAVLPIAKSDKKDEGVDAGSYLVTLYLVLDFKKDNFASLRKLLKISEPSFERSSFSAYA